MSEEWLWNKNTSSEGVETEKKEDVSAGEEKVVVEKVGGEEVVAESVDSEQVASERTTSETKSEETYHWVNPEYQKRQSEGTAKNSENTYDSTNYRDSVKSERTVNQGYYGGSYHSSEWKTRYDANKATQREESVNSDYMQYDLNESTVEKSEFRKQERPFLKKIAKTAACAVIFGVVAGGVMFGVNKFANHFWGDEPANGQYTQVPTVQLQQGSSSKDENSGNVSSGTVYSVNDVAENCMPSLVSITCASVTKVQNYFGSVWEEPTESSGSGIIVGQNDTELLIATNNHVIEGADTVTVAFNDDSVYAAQKKGSASDADLAVIAVRLSDISEDTLKAIRVIQIGDSDDLELGEQVVAIGNALGYGQSVTSGWVSALNRSVEDSDGKVADSLIQTDAAINPGNSGGALLNMRGELVGINSAKVAETKVEGMGYAISIAKAEPILNELMNIKTRYKVDESEACYIGVTCYSVQAVATQMYGIPAGAFIESVEKGGPVDKAGMQKGDVIVKFDNQRVAGSTELIELLDYYAAGETVEIVVARAEQGEYKEVTLTVTLGHLKDMKNNS